MILTKLDLAVSIPLLNIYPLTPFDLVIIFDIVYYNGTHLVDYALSDRRKLLANVLIERRGYLNILEYKERSTEQDIIDEMTVVVEQRYVWEHEREAPFN